MKNVVSQAVSVTALSCFALFAGVAYAADITISVASGDADRTLTASDVEELGASDNLVKTGGGRLIIDFDLAQSKSGWTGAVKVSEGFLRVSHVGALGPSGAAGAVVADGATIEFNGSALGSSSLSCPKLSVCGSGVDSAGAIQLVGASWSHKAMQWTLTGDTVWSSPAGLTETFEYAAAGAIDMGGKTLRVVGSGTKGTLVLNSTADGFFANPGHLRVVNATLCTQQLPFGGSESNTLTFEGSCKWTLATLPKEKCPWKIIVLDGASVDASAVSWSSVWPTDTCGWSGPVEIGAGGSFGWSATYQAGSQQTLALDGRISGSGKLVCWYGFLKLTNAENEIAEIQNYQGRIVATSLSSVMPSFANSKFYTNYGAATSVVQVVAADMTAANDSAVAAFMRNYPTGFRGNGGNGYVYLLLSSDWSYSSAFDGAFAEAGLFGNGGIAGLPESAGFRVTGTVTGSNPVAVTKATTDLTFAGAGNHAVGQLLLSNGVTAFAEAGHYDLGTGQHYVGAAYPGVARLIVGEGAALSCGGSTDASQTAINVGRSYLGADTTARGILTMTGGVLTNCVSMIGNVGTSAPRSQGSFVIKGGTWTCSDTSGGTLVCVGNAIGGYLSLQGGAIDFDQGWFTVGQGADGYGAFEMLGGSYVHRVHALGVGRSGGHGQAYFGGGTADLVSLRLCHSQWAGATDSPNVRSTFTVDGDAHVTARSLQLGASSDSVTVLNLNGGVFEAAPQFFALTNSQQINSSMSSFDFTNNLVCINLNGGVLKPTYGSSDLFRNADAADVLRVVVGKGGFRLDTRGLDGAVRNFTEYRALNPATGKGVGSIPVPEGVAAWECTGAPYVEIEGDGWGATAFAQFDNEAGVVTNVLVTSPGCDYTWAKARFVKGGSAADVEVSLDDRLVENGTDGGLEVFGGGSLTLAGANGYRGATRIGKDTTVVFWTRQCYPNDGDGKPRSDLVNAGGTFRLGQSSQTAIQFPTLSGYGTVEGSCGSAVFCTTVKETLAADANDLLDGKKLVVSGQLTLDAGVTVRIANGEALADCPPGTRLVVAEAGKVVCTGEKPTLEGLDETWALRVGATRVTLVRRGSGMTVILR